MMQPSRPVSILLARFQRLPRRSSHTWQGGIVRMPVWQFALVNFRTGRRAEAKGMVARALDTNVYVPEALAVDPDELPAVGDAIALGGVDEAIDYAWNFGEAWHRRPGAIEWLQREAANPVVARGKKVVSEQVAASPAAGAEELDPPAHACRRGRENLS